MALLTLDDDNKEVPLEHKFRSQEELQTSVVFNDDLDISLIKNKVDGLPWTVDYFNQILSVNSEQLMPDVNTSESILKYNRIDKLDIMLESGLPQGGVNDLVGTGIINAGFIPFYGDAFSATIAGGRIGLFVITSVKKEYYNTHDIYLIEFKLHSFIEESPEIYNDLVYKTVNVYVYDKEAIGTYSTPVLTAKDYKKLLDLKKEPSKIIKHYINLFFNKDKKFLTLPTELSTYIDQLVSDAFFKIVSVNDHPDVASISRVKNNISSTTIWDALLNGDIELLETCNMNLYFALNNAERTSSVKLLSYLGVEFLITENLAAVRSDPAVIENTLTKTVEIPVQRDGNYIFPVEFYTQDATYTCSKFETLVLEYLRGETPNRDLLEEVLSEYKYWNYLDQYQLLPILLIIINRLITVSYSSI